MAGQALIGGTRYRMPVATRAPTDLTAPLPWKPPTLTSPTTYYVTNSQAGAAVTIPAGADAIVAFPNSPINWAANFGTRPALVSIVGGRNVVIIGGHITAPPQIYTTLVGDLPYTSSTIQVQSTAGFSNSGPLRIQGEGIFYTSIDATHFYGCTRNGIYFNASVAGNNAPIYANGDPHPNGSTVVSGEFHRTGLSLVNQTGTVHIEGLLIDGTLDGWTTPYASLSDGIEATFRTNSGTVLQVQNCRIGPNGPWDQTYVTDSHADCIQLIGSPGTFRVARSTLMSAQGGRGILNQGSNSNSLLGTATLQDVEFLRQTSINTRNSIYNYDATYPWNLTNVWDCDDTGLGQCRDQAGPINLGAVNANLSVVQRQFCPLGVPGENYVSPGYVA